jgi:hypothetical protein
MEQIGRFDFSPILAGDFDRATTPVTLVSGQVYKLGSVLMRGDDGRFSLIDSAGDDPEAGIIAKPYAVLAEEVDATTADGTGAAWLTGQFIRTRLVFGGTDTWETHEVAAREVSIFFRDSAQQPNQ